MNSSRFTMIAVSFGIALALSPVGIAAGGDSGDQTGVPAKVYVPYEELKGVFEKADQGVFLPYADFQKLWRAAQKKPADAGEAPFEYLVSTAKFHGKVVEELATIRLELTIDVLADGWVQIPVGLGSVAVAQASLLETGNAKVVPLLRVEEGRYIFVTKGKGRYVLALDFVRQLETQPGLAVLDFQIPSAAITTLELLIPEENLKVDVQPMLAATTSQVDADGAKATKLQAFLGAAKQVRLSWKPKTETVADLEPVVVCEQFQHMDIGEALISCRTKLDYSIHRGGVDEFTIKLPGGFRVTEVSGANIAKWEVKTADKAQVLSVKLFAPAKGKYSLAVKTERFFQEAGATIPISPIETEQVFRQSGLIGITRSPRRSVHLENIRKLARVDTGQLPEDLRNKPGVTAYRFITSDYSGQIVIETASPRIAVDQLWMLGVDSDRLELRGKIHYKVERTGIFEIGMNLPEPWKLEAVEPRDLVDDFQLKGSGPDRVLHILLKSEKAGDFDLMLVARADRDRPDSPVDFPLPLADANNVHLYRGQLMLLLPNQLQAQLDEARQLQAIPVKQATNWGEMAGLSPAMAFEFAAIDRDKPAGANFKVDVKPVQISATVHRLVNIQPGSVEQQAVVQYRIRYAPIDIFYLKMPADMADAGVQITGANIKEKPRIDELPADQRVEPNESGAEGSDWAYYKIVLQSKVTGSYQLVVRTRKPFQADTASQPSVLEIEPILAAGRLSDQNGHIAVAKAETLAIGQPVTRNIKEADPGSAADLPYQPHRDLAALAFKYDSAEFALSLPVVTQKEATVFTTIVSGAIIEQVLARDGMLNTYATYLLATSHGDRLGITLPKDHKLTAVLLNGSEAPTEMGIKADERIVRLPPSAGQVSKFVLEIAYSLDKASASNLTAPQLPQEIPVQQTLWRLWIPQDRCLLGYDRVFARLQTYQGHRMLETMQRNQPSAVAFKLTGQGKELHFIRQGAPGELSVLLVGKEVFSVAVWVLIAGVGILMLKLSGFRRVLVLLVVALVAGIAHLYLPLLVAGVIDVGKFAAILVLLLWIAHWAFTKIPTLQLSLAALRKKRPSKPETAKKENAPDREQPEKDQE
ncbi:MAG: hypothetical protein JW720_08285 [Sedimentisphaerales bacterium]|nr:hypothetical protein [Sedimentisphaerales bacterium]